MKYRLCFCLLVSSLSVFGLINGAQAQPVTSTFDFNYSFNGRFQHFNVDGDLLYEDTSVTGRFDFNKNYGFIESTIPFNGNKWFGDTLMMIQWQGEPGSGTISHHEFVWSVTQYWVFGKTVACTVVKDLYDECWSKRKPYWLKISEDQYTYDFELFEGEFAGVLLMDFPSDQDIPIISAMHIESIDENATFVVSSIDTDKDGIPGTQMLSGPYAGETFSYDGMQTLSQIDTPLFSINIEYYSDHPQETYIVGDKDRVKVPRLGAGIKQSKNKWEIIVKHPAVENTLTNYSMITCKSKQLCEIQAREFVSQHLRDGISSGKNIKSINLAD